MADAGRCRRISAGPEIPIDRERQRGWPDEQAVEGERRCAA